MEQQPEQQAAQPQQVWREESSSKQQNPEAERRRQHIIGKVGTKFPKCSMNAKANMLNDLLSKFKPNRAEHHGDCCEGRIKDRFHFVKKVQKPKTRTFCHKDRKLYLRKSNINELVSQMNSPSFGIQADPKEFDINRGMLTISFFDKTPREPLPQVDISEESSQDIGPEVTRKLDNCSIDSDWQISTIIDMQQQ